MSSSFNSHAPASQDPPPAPIDIREDFQTKYLIEQNTSKMLRETQMAVTSASMEAFTLARTLILAGASTVTEPMLKTQQNFLSHGQTFNNAQSFNCPPGPSFPPPSHSAPAGNSSSVTATLNGKTVVIHDGKVFTSEGRTLDGAPSNESNRRHPPHDETSSSSDSDDSSSDNSDNDSSSSSSSSSSNSSRHHKSSSKKKSRKESKKEKKSSKKKSKKRKKTKQEKKSSKKSKRR